MAKKGKEPAGLKRYRLAQKRKKRKKRVGMHAPTGVHKHRFRTIKAHQRWVAKRPKKRRKKRVGELVNVTHRVKRVGKKRKKATTKRTTRRRKNSTIGSISTHGMFMKALHGVKRIF